ncbi:MAG: FAD-dependent oxidoreductase [Chloroflexota bacterium]
MTESVSLIGNGACVAQCALMLAELGIEVSVITPSPSLCVDSHYPVAPDAPQSPPYLWPLVLRAATHPLVKLYTNTRVEDITGKQGDFKIRAVRQPRYVIEDLCTGCGRCEAECSVKIQAHVDGRKIVHGAIHMPVPEAKAAPSAYYIEKNGPAPCRASCPLEINVQGFTALLAKGKVDKALSLITEKAPMPGILGRLCTHPCEANCARGKVDSPVFIQALHRYVGDHAPGGVTYTRKAPASSRKGRIAVLGSGPAGLACAWELARRGYTPTIFEARGVIGGMIATGVPRFRLPREVREREVADILALGIEVKTGVTVGRDVTYADLVERGYKAFFIAIGAQQNKRLNIPGEDLDGVVDSISLLFALNLRVGASVGSNVVVIGGGNSAVDSARAAIKHSKGSVRILCVTSEMTAVKEEVEEAIGEGVTIDYLTSAVEILGSDGKVTGIRCQRVKRAEIEPGGRLNFELEQGSDFVIEADHVVVAIGQRPNIPELNIKGLEIDSGSNNIKIDPVTLETNIPGVFAGGDCVTGPNHVVDAVAAGLEAAKSINRYLRGRDLRRGRSTEKPKPAEVDISQKEPATYKRARMPIIRLSKRKATYEETNLGLPEEVAKREAERCLSCALCCECLECEHVCEAGAINHRDQARHLDIKAGNIITLVEDKSTGQPDKLGLYHLGVTDGHSLEYRLSQASVLALKVAARIKKREEGAGEQKALAERRDKIEPVRSNGGQTGVVLCSCGGSISSVVDFEEVTEEVLKLEEVYSVHEVSQACTADGAKQIADFVASRNLGRVVLAACRCCNLGQICFSCSDRRVLCQQNFNLEALRDISVDFVNIREQCAWPHTKDTRGATLKAADLIAAAVNHVEIPVPQARHIEASAFILSNGLSGLAAAVSLVVEGYQVTLAFGQGARKSKRELTPEYNRRVTSLLKQLEELGVPNSSWPKAVELHGSPGSFEVVLKCNADTYQTKAGVIILDSCAAEDKEFSVGKVIDKSSFLGRLLAKGAGSNGSDSAATRRYAIGETAGVFLTCSDAKLSPDEQISRGQEVAAQAAAYLRRDVFVPRANAVHIETSLCRGCGDCAVLCPFIMMHGMDGLTYASVDAALCYGCGACVACCPTGAITQPIQSNREMEFILKTLLERAVKESGEVI